MFKAVNNRKRSGYVDSSVVRSIDRTQATHFEAVMTTVDEVSDKTKVADEFILRSVLLDCFTAELDK